MNYPVKNQVIIDVTQPPYCADNTGKTDCTAILCKILDDILIREVTALQQTHDRLLQLSNGKTENVYIGLECARVQNGRLSVTYPEYEPAPKTIYFPKGTYLVSDTITYSLENLKQFWYHVPGYENCRHIHLMGENRDETVIRLADNSPGFEAGAQKPLISFTNHEMKVERNQEFTNVAFMNTIEDITLHCGKGNPGAMGLKYVSSNCGRIERVSVTAEEGYCGIFVANNTTQAVFANNTVSGFDYGLDAESTGVLVIDGLDVSGVKIAGIYTDGSSLLCRNVVWGDAPAVRFKDGCKSGRYYFADENITLSDKPEGAYIYMEHTACAQTHSMPVNRRSQDPCDWVCVDEFGAKGDGITDSSAAIQRAMDSGKPVVVFGEGEYLINKKIKIPATVQTVDFLFCSLACGDRLIGGEYDAAFEICEDGNTTLFLENLSAWERFKGHIRLVKHAARRDSVFSDIHLMSASLYFNSVPGSKVYFDNCFTTAGTYTRTAWIPGDGFVPVYSHILPYEFHGQAVYGRMLNPERADLAMLCDGADVFLDGYRIEGSGTALKAVNGAKVQVNLFNAACGCKDAENPVFDFKDSRAQLNQLLFYYTGKDSEYATLIRDKSGQQPACMRWEDAPDCSWVPAKLLNSFQNN